MSSNEGVDESTVPVAQQEQLSRMRSQQAIATEQAQDKVGRSEWTDIKRVIVHASHEGKNFDTVRVEMLGGRVVTIKAPWSSAEVSDSRDEGN